MTPQDDGLRVALDEVFEPYFRLAGMDGARIAVVLDGAAARLAAYHGVALAAAPRERLDVERLDQAMAAAVFGWASGPRHNIAVAIAREYAALAPEADLPGPPVAAWRDVSGQDGPE